MYRITVLKMDQKYTIYVLRLINDKYYVGKTRDLNTRINQHQAHTASAWTTKYPMIDVFQTYLGDAYDEDKYVIKYMGEYGIENVRGGSYSNIELSMDQHIAIRRALCTAGNACVACGLIGHFIQDCKEDICYRCGRTGHLVKDCNAKLHVLNGKLDGCYRCGRPDHWAIRCNRSKDVYGRLLPKNWLMSLLSWS